MNQINTRHQTTQATIFNNALQEHNFLSFNLTHIAELKQVGL